LCLSNNPKRFSPGSDRIRDGKSVFWKFSLLWFRSNFFVRLFFYLSIAFIFAIWVFGYPDEQADFLRYCGWVFRYCNKCSEFPFNYLLCLYPLLTVLVLQALVQRQLLKNAKVSVSAWWVAAPVLASLSLMFVSPEITCDDCKMLKYLMSGLIPEFDAQIRIALILYFGVVGCIQWLVLRRSLHSSSGWAIMPLINAMLVLLVYPILYYYEKFFLLLPLALIGSDFIPAIYISWLIHVKKTEPAIS